ncbi:hypothetical protein CHS0354_031201 [Potamilus streckersoni]|uniref:Uncharacterized protein n=1 Tax=Potamilus streckersoni TaxID=2493646 RepID=A0AAE0TKF9_9BIVA|nr:hypothetical protein CHS0354_031201 [Potamilus streckersoni]
MNLIVLFLLSQTLSTFVSKAESYFDYFKKSCFWGNVIQGLPTQERGYMKNCHLNSSYNISWEPKDVDPHGSLKFFINYTAPADFRRGEYSVHIKYRFIHVSKTAKITSEDLGGTTIMKDSAAPPLTCEIRDVIRFKNFKGTFKVTISAENENNENVLCGTLEVNLL